MAFVLLSSHIDYSLIISPTIRPVHHSSCYSRPFSTKHYEQNIQSCLITFCNKSSQVAKIERKNPICVILSDIIITSDLRSKFD